MTAITPGAPLSFLEIASGASGRSPEMVHRRVGIEKLEPGTFSVMAVHIRVADVVILFRVELSFDQIELVLQHSECDGYVMFHPDALLIADYPVGAAADNVAQIFRLAHHLHGDIARRVAHLQRAVYVKTDELRQTCSSFGFVEISRILC